MVAVAVLVAGRAEVDRAQDAREAAIVIAVVRKLLALAGGKGWRASLGPGFAPGGTSSCDRASFKTGGGRALGVSLPSNGGPSGRTRGDQGGPESGSTIGRSLGITGRRWAQESNPGPGTTTEGGRITDIPKEIRNGQR